MTLFLVLRAWRGETFDKSNPGKESRACGEAARSMRGNSLVPSHTYLGGQPKYNASMWERLTHMIGCDQLLPATPMIVTVTSTSEKNGFFSSTSACILGSSALANSAAPATMKLLAWTIA